MTTGLDDYRNGRKNNWRGWQWNRIVERLSVPVEDATVLYLCGPDDVDREKALARGFRNENLIAVDVVEEYIGRIRSTGGLGIRHNLHDLLWAWPQDWPLHVVIADYCAGITRETSRLKNILALGPAISQPGVTTVVCANFQRGRDAWSNPIRDVHKDLFSTEWTPDELVVVLAKLRAMGVDDPTKNRAFIFTMEYRAALRRWLVDAGWCVRDAAELSRTDLGIAFKTYRSSRVQMDSVVLRAACRRVDGSLRLPQLAVARRKIAACRALRTVKLRAG
jgi:hypothetical protein